MTNKGNPVTKEPPQIGGLRLLKATLGLQNLDLLESRLVVLSYAGGAADLAGTAECRLRRVDKCCQHHFGSESEPGEAGSAPRFR